LSQVAPASSGCDYQFHYYRTVATCGGGAAPFVEVKIGGRTIVAPHVVTPVGAAIRITRCSAMFCRHQLVLCNWLSSRAAAGRNAALLIDNVSFVPARTVLLAGGGDAGGGSDHQQHRPAERQANPGGSPAMAWFQWGADTNYGT